VCTTGGGGMADNGTVFSLAPNGTLTTLFSFSAPSGNHF